MTEERFTALTKQANIYKDNYQENAKGWIGQKAALESQNQTLIAENQALADRLAQSQAEGASIKGKYEDESRAHSERERITQEKVKQIVNLMNQNTLEKKTIQERLCGVEAERDALRSRLCEEAKICTELKGRVYFHPLLTCRTSNASKLREG